MGGEAFPWFFECIKDKGTVVNWVQLYGYPNKIMDLRPDFGIAPLCENYFNFSKSNIKALEQYAIGSAFIGGVFEHNVSPYDDCIL
ncbi:hypothetical protein M3M44_09175, partial [Lactobacillus johnsonii]|uniref:hypothetical protein n=1 Tax=Lactobacillus johnsonii TaxID=33959 RepID=UPI00201A459F